MNVNDLQVKVQEHAVKVVEKKLNRLQRRCFVFFPWLRARRLLRLVRYIKKG